MISKDTFRFLRTLKGNNYKEWFDENRDKYQAARKEFEHVVNILIYEVSLFDKVAAHTTAKECIFRINRDIRFSKDKLPYKTNLGAFIANGGRKSVFAGYYIHVEPGTSFLSGGIYMPSGPVLKAIRTEISDHFEEFTAIIKHPEFLSHFGTELWGEKLKTTPKGFPKDFAGLDYLKYKHYTVVKDLPDDAYFSPDFVYKAKQVFQAMAPFNAFLNRAVENVVV